ncbi:SUF system Fe-S cluster assembly regulator [Pseudogulbenkiania ferrooxidans]|uniref:Transcriptional regulator, BadM/Rrf2 family n=1 Tax=Pseudogulbenkiania ferrooxidans 2002 TaxID=279714 RepID=B9Z0E9_9NEIS|nr:SUF system Fe-S cluster assembly regulator [Pseudogulbenkiania ferrooxidans]EEG09555.1 transcriptional regulator, BadM/Rrf2 family [Pseudogulbenkiania ferrooxidans 2002]
MLRLSRLTDYGTVIMAHMAREPGHVYSAAELAGAVGVALPTASKILKTLARKALLHSLRGAHGGYLLARPPREISIAQVIDALEGPFGVTECSVAAGLCPQENACALRRHWQRIDRALRQTLDGLTLEDMTQPVPAGMPERRRAQHDRRHRSDGHG